MGKVSYEQVEDVTEEKVSRSNDDSRIRIDVDENEKFEDISRKKYITATDFCKMVSGMFRSVFADYEGCVTEKDQQGHLSIALYFNHSEPMIRPDGAQFHGITRETPEDDGIKNDVVRRIREHDTRNKYGDRYFLTEAAKSGISDFIYDGCFRKDGSVNWGKITAEVNVNPGAINQPPVINTKVSLLDPIKLAERIYGKTDEDGDNWVYDVKVVSLPRAAVSIQYQPEDMLCIEAVRESEVTKLANWAGYAPNVGINIIR